MNSLRRILGVLALAALVAAAGGCGSLEKKPPGDATASADAEIAAAENDPFEGFNRAMFRFNDALDRAVVRPMASGYVAVLPQPLRNRFRSFFLNMLEPTTIVNGVLQGKITQAAFDSVRFVLNTTFGLLGFFDVASWFELERHEEDFGQTFAAWGIGSGPYLVLPLVGPSNLRDGIGLVPQFFLLDPRVALSENEIRWGLLAWDYLDTRSTLLGASRVLDLQLDPYLFVRESYRQRRLNLIHDGNPPLETLEEKW